MSRADKTATNAYYDIQIDPETQLPKRMRILLLTGQKGLTEVKNNKIVGGDHVAFHFEYELSEFGRKAGSIPPKAKKILDSLR